eukprot:9688401-Alexandrium_andersonii.AAC.1
MGSACARLLSAAALVCRARAQTLFRATALKAQAGAVAWGGRSWNTGPAPALRLQLTGSRRHDRNKTLLKATIAGRAP